MESDDDYQQFSTLDEPSSPIRQNKLKRLKKAIRVSSNVPISQSIGSIPSSNIIGSNGISDQEVSETSDVEKPVDLVGRVSESEEINGEKDVDNKLDELFVYQARGEDRAMLDVEREELFEVSNAIEDQFVGKEGDGSNKFGDAEMGEKKKSVKKKGNPKDGEKKNKKKSKKRGKSVDEKENSEAPARNKRKLEKERQAHLKELHAESQRLLRETRDAEFKPVPLVHKPISSILEKIRQRKLEVSQKASMLTNHVETNGFARDIVIDLYPEEASNVNLGHKEHERNINIVNKESIDDTHMENSREPTSLPSPSKTTLSNTAEEEEFKSSFRAPINDTEDLFDDFQQSDGEDLKDSEEDNHVEEVLAPSVLAMNLMLDSAPPEDVNESGARFV
ncbi:Dna ligase-like protein [Thalictrum thalictroides]|uniref:Dna ligase-like protein n=1 Tax=Thalictrum thalictroides TaxID=46969 RepID=A0A7J6V762_THATH|nr:Dna ligase-like protein [Thalictrum thalictroides]